MTNEEQKTKRRSPGQGSVDRLPSGKHRVRVTTAKLERITLVADTAEEADGLRLGVVAELAEAKMAPVGGITLAAWGPVVLDRREMAGGRNSKTDRQRWALHIATAPFAIEPLVNLRPRDVRHWVDALSRKAVTRKYPGTRKSKRLSAQSVKHCLILLRRVLEAAVEDEIIVANPARDVRPPARELRTEEPWTWLTLEEQEALLACKAIPEAERCLVGFAIGTGLRQGEQWNLELRDVHLDGPDPFVFVRFGSKGKPPKNGKMRRVPLFGLGLVSARRWMTLLDRYAMRRPNPNSKERVYHNPQHLAFPTERGCRRQKGEPRHFQAWLRAAGIDRSVRWHDLRHTCASSLVAAWWGKAWRLDEVRDLLGHSSVTVTERYAHLADSALRAAARDTHGALSFAVAGRSREGHAGSSAIATAGTFPLRATQDSNLRPTAPENEGQPLSFSALSPPRDLGVTEAAQRFLEATAEGSSRALVEGLAEQLADAVLALPEFRLAMIVKDCGQHMLARATDLARRIRAQGETRHTPEAKQRKSVRR
jgi:integrase